VADHSLWKTNKKEKEKNISEARLRRAPNSFFI
jgi:hypothetical protein